MILDISYDLKNTVRNSVQNFVALELTKIAITQEKENGHIITDTDVLRIYNKMVGGM